MILSRLWAGILRTTAYTMVFGVSAFFYSCDRLTPLPKAPPNLPALAPSSNELYVFPHGRLSMSEFETLQREFPVVSPVNVSRIAMAAQWLQTKALPGKTPTLKETTRCVRAAFPPDVSKDEALAASKFAAETFGFASLDLLRLSFIKALGGWVIEWNPSVAHEYGFPTTKH